MGDGSTTAIPSVSVVTATATILRPFGVFPMPSSSTSKVSSTASIPFGSKKDLAAGFLGGLFLACAQTLANWDD